MIALVRLVRQGHPARNRLGLAVLAGIAALGCAIGLFAVSGFLIARAAQHPSITALTVVRALTCSSISDCWAALSRAASLTR